MEKKKAHKRPSRRTSSPVSAPSSSGKLQPSFEFTSLLNGLRDFPNKIIIDRLTRAAEKAAILQLAGRVAGGALPKAHLENLKKIAELSVSSENDKSASSSLSSSRPPDGISSKQKRSALLSPEAIRDAVFDLCRKTTLAEHKLYLLYVADAVMFNVGTPYLELFSPLLPEAFKSAHFSLPLKDRARAVVMLSAWAERRGSSQHGLTNDVLEPMLGYVAFHDQMVALLRSLAQSATKATIDKLTAMIMYASNRRDGIVKGDVTKGLVTECLEGDISPLHRLHLIYLLDSASYNLGGATRAAYASMIPRAFELACSVAADNIIKRSLYDFLSAFETRKQQRISPDGLAAMQALKSSLMPEQEDAEEGPGGTNVTPGKRKAEDRASPRLVRRRSSGTFELIESFCEGSHDAARAFECAKQKLLKPNDFADIVIERSISGLCGNLMCVDRIPLDKLRRKRRIISKAQKTAHVDAFCSSRCIDQWKVMIKEIKELYENSANEPAGVPSLISPSQMRVVERTSETLRSVKAGEAAGSIDGPPKPPPRTISSPLAKHKGAVGEEKESASVDDDDDGSLAFFDAADSKDILEQEKSIMNASPFRVLHAALETWVSSSTRALYVKSEDAASSSSYDKAAQDMLSSVPEAVRALILDEKRKTPDDASRMSVIVRHLAGGVNKLVRSMRAASVPRPNLAAACSRKQVTACKMLPVRAMQAEMNEVARTFNVDRAVPHWKSSGNIWMLLSIIILSKGLQSPSVRVNCAPGSEEEREYIQNSLCEAAECAGISREELMRLCWVLGKD